MPRVPQSLLGPLGTLTKNATSLSHHSIVPLMPLMWQAFQKDRCMTCFVHFHWKMFSIEDL
jgi:hypothetical protein